MIVRGAGAAKADQDFWVERLGTMTSGVQEIILAFLAEFPSEFNWFTTVQKRKEAALKSKDSAAWAAIVAEEKEKIKNLAAMPITKPFYNYDF